MRFDKRILILTPTKLPSITGNAINTERWKRLLMMAGAQVEMVATEGAKAFQIAEKIEFFKPDIIHGHHALKTGSLFLENEVSGAMGNTPLVISLPGTDINIGIKTHREVIINILNMASGILCQSRAIEEIVKREFSHLTDKIFYIPRSILWSGEEEIDIRKTARCGNGDILFFHPAGIRPVKGNLECLEFFEHLNRVRKNAKILFSGPILDVEYGRHFMEKMKECFEFATWIPSILPEAMKSAYRGVDIVLNTSFSEGISTVILEAIHLSRPVLASDIQSNRWLLTQNNNTGPCGLLYRMSSQGDFIKKALLLIDDRHIREKLSEKTKERIRDLPRPEDEMACLIETLKKVLS